MIRPTVLEESRTQVFHCCQSIMPATHHMIFGKYWTVCTEYTYDLARYFYFPFVVVRQRERVSDDESSCHGTARDSTSNRHGQHFCIFYEMFIKENPLSGIFHINPTKIAIACTIFRNESIKKLSICQYEVKKERFLDAHIQKLPPKCEAK